MFTSLFGFNKYYVDFCRNVTGRIKKAALHLPDLGGAEGGLPHPAEKEIRRKELPQDGSIGGRAAIKDESRG